MTMSPDEMAAVFDDTKRHIAGMEVIRIKEGLWKAALWEVRVRLGPLDDDLFGAAASLVLQQVKHGFEAYPEYQGVVQDAISEFRTEARRLYVARPDSA